MNIQFGAALVFGAVLVAGSVHAAPSAWLQEQTGNMHRVSGRFVSREYGFSVELPREATEYVTNGGDANHGVVLILGERREIIVYPEYTGFVPGDDVPCTGQPFPWQTAGNTRNGTGELNGQKVCVLTFVNGDVIRRVMQTAGNDRGTGIMYTLMLETTLRSSSNDLVIFQKIADSFRRIPISP